MTRLALDSHKTRGSGSIVILNDFSGLGSLERRTRVSKRGKRSDKVTVTIQSEPLLHNLNELALGRKPAMAIRDSLSTQIKQIQARASPSTILFRNTAERALQRGARWAVKRYSGGRTGTKRPNQSDRLFNDSYRLAEGLAVNANPKAGGWTINVPKNRLDAETFQNDAQLVAMFEKLRQYVPAFGDARKLGEDRKVRAALADTISDAIIKKQLMVAAKQKQLRREIAKLLAQVARGALAV